MRTRSRPASSMRVSRSSSISWLAWTITSPANGSRISASAGVRHHEDRVEARRGALVALRVGEGLAAELAQHLVSDAVGHLRPDVDDLVVTLAVGDEALVVLVFDLPHLARRFLEERRLV